MTPYYQDDAVTIYHGDCHEVIPSLGTFDLLLTDPPYGIRRDKGIGGAGFDGFGGNCKRAPKAYAGGWDDARPDAETFSTILAVASQHIIWGGNYFSDLLPVQSKWLVWDKLQTMPSYSDCELAWTSLSGVSVKMFHYAGAGLMSAEKFRQHPTQKPLALMSWCIGLAGAVTTIIDPFSGSGTTGRAAKDLGKKAVLVEHEERYCEIGAKRMEQEVLDLDAPRPAESEALSGYLFSAKEVA